MAALTTDAQRPIRGVYETAHVQLSGSAGTVYKGAILVQDVSALDGYAIPAAGTAATGDIFCGVNLGRVKVASGSGNGDYKALVISKGRVGFPVGSFAQADTGSIVYASDDNTITTTSTGNFRVGKIVEVDSDYAWVEVGDYFMTAQ